MSRKIYKEKQRVKDPVAMGVLTLLFGYSTYLLFKELLLSDSINTTSISLLSLAVVFLGAAMWVLHTLSLKVAVTKDGINYKMSPLHQRKHKIKWEEVDRCRVIETPKNAHMHSSNMKFWFEKKFTLSGRTGVAVLTKDGEEVFIGSRKTEELRRSINQALRSAGRKGATQ